MINSVFPRNFHLVPLAFLLLFGAASQHSLRDLRVLAKTQNVCKEYPPCPFPPFELEAWSDSTGLEVFPCRSVQRRSARRGAVPEEPRGLEAAGKAALVVSPGLSGSCLPVPVPGCRLRGLFPLFSARQALVLMPGRCFGSAAGTEQLPLP